MKRLLSLTLCAILLLGAAIPVYALNTEENTTETTVPSESVPETTAAPTDETKDPQEIQGTETQPSTEETKIPNTTIQETPDVTHIDGCSDDCTKEDCACPCHEETFFEKIMATSSFEEFNKLIESSTDEDWISLSAEQIDQLNAHLHDIEPDPLPAVEIEESDDPVPSEIVYVTVNFTNVAPLVDSEK